MYLRTTTRRAADGTTVRYLQLAHNEWDPAARRSKVRVLYHFGREDELDRDAIRRLIGSLSRALPPGEALIAAAPPELRFLESRRLGARRPVAEARPARDPGPRPARPAPRSFGRAGPSRDGGQPGPRPGVRA